MHYTAARQSRATRASPDCRATLHDVGTANPPEGVRDLDLAAPGRAGASPPPYRHHVRAAGAAGVPSTTAAPAVNAESETTRDGTGCNCVQAPTALLIRHRSHPGSGQARADHGQRLSSWISTGRRTADVFSRRLRRSTVRSVPAAQELNPPRPAHPGRRSAQSDTRSAAYDGCGYTVDHISGWPHSLNDLHTGSR